LQNAIASYYFYKQEKSLQFGEITEIIKELFPEVLTGEKIHLKQLQEAFVNFYQGDQHQAVDEVKKIIDTSPKLKSQIIIPTD
jgi:hypothetical protein